VAGVGGTGGTGYYAQGIPVGSLAGGGGGGGGYYGGGGGAGSGDAGGGGGGGSSFTVVGASGVSGPIVTAASPGVGITYDAPTADESVDSISFPAQTVSTVSVQKTLTLTNQGSAPLVVSGVLLGGANPDDYLINDGCQQSVAVGSSCAIVVGFAPHARGARSATLTAQTNAPTAPATVMLSGTATSPQSITWPRQGPYTYGQPPVRLKATASSGLAVRYKVVSGPCSVKASKLTLTGAGSCFVEANQGGSGAYSPAAPVAHVITINPKHHATAASP
jgi:hypothetical protein